MPGAALGPKPKHLSGEALEAEDTRALTGGSKPHVSRAEPHEGPASGRKVSAVPAKPPSTPQPPAAGQRDLPRGTPGDLAEGIPATPRLRCPRRPAHLDLHEGAAVEAAGGRRQGAPQAAALRHGAARRARSGLTRPGPARPRAAPPLPPPPPGFNFSRFPDYLIPCRQREAAPRRQLRPGPPRRDPGPPQRPSAARGAAVPRGSGVPAAPEGSRAY